MKTINSFIKITQFDYSNTPISPKRPKFSYESKTKGVPPLISIVTPFYNTGEIFWETAYSIFQQSFQNFEWIIVNDGSDEPKSIEILSQIRSLDPRIRVIDHSANQGLPSARNTGTKQANTPFVLFLDSDDLLEPTAAEKWYWFLKENPRYSFVKGYTVGFGAYNYLWARGFHQKQYFLRENLVDVTSMIRKEVIDDIGGFDEELRNGFEDWDFWLRCANKGYWGATIPEYLNWYRRRENSRQRWQAFENPKKYIRTINQKYKNLNRRYFSSLPKVSIVSNNTTQQENFLAKSKPRLLMIIPWFSLGGADKFNLDLIRLLVQNQWEVTIATTLLSEDPWWQEFSKLTPDIFMLHRFLPIKSYPDFLVYLIKTRDPDVVFITNSEVGYMLLPYLRSLCPKPLYIDFCHMEEEEWNGGGYPRLSLKNQKFLDITILSSEHLRKWMIDRGGNIERVQTCYTNVDTKQWKPDENIRNEIRCELGLEKNLPIILYAARFCEQKQPLIFAQVIKILADRGHDFVALAVGDGPDKDDLVYFIKKHKLEKRIRLIGAVEPDRMKKLFQASDIFFLPSKWEGIALSIFEAMSCGLAVVGADVGGQSELVDENSGILIKPTGDPQKDIEIYSHALSELICDKEKRVTLGKNARQRVVDNFDLDNMIKRIFYLFDYARNIRDKTTISVLNSVDLLEVATKFVNDYSARSSTTVELLNNYRQHPTFRIRIYYWLRTHLYSLYYSLKRRGWKWVPKTKNFLVKILTHGSIEEP